MCTTDEPAEVCIIAVRLLGVTAAGGVSVAAFLHTYTIEHGQANKAFLDSIPSLDVYLQQ